MNSSSNSYKTSADANMETGEWLASKTRAYLAKPVRQKLGSRIAANPPAPTLHARNAAAESSGVTVYGTLFSETGSKGGSAGTAASDFQTLRMLKRLGARLNAVKELNRSH